MHPNPERVKTALQDFLGRLEGQGVQWGVLMLQEFCGHGAVVAPTTPEGHVVLLAPPSADGPRRIALLVIF